VTVASQALEVTVDPIACEAYGYCAELLGEIISLDEWGFPIVRDGPVPMELVTLAKKAARDCPRRALILRKHDPEAGGAQRPTVSVRSAGGGT
jgi:ferredoxin